MTENNQDFAGKSVLIVDDSALVAEKIQRTFKGLGLNVVGHVEDGLQAIEAYEQHKPDLICMDIIMANMNGIECGKKIHAKHPEAKIIYLSSIARGVLEKSFKGTINGNNFLEKPLGEEELKACLSSVFS